MSGNVITAAVSAARWLRADPLHAEASSAELRRRYRTGVLVTCCATGLFLAWLLSGVGQEQTRRLVSDMVFILAPLAAARCCWRAHQLRGGRHTGWSWLAAGCLMWAAGSAVFTAYLLLGQPAPFPSPADIGYIGYAAPVVIGLRRFPCPTSTVWSRWRLTLDALVIAGCLLLMSAVWVLQPVLDAAASSPFTRIDAIAYPCADVVVAAVMLSRAMVFPVARRRVMYQLSAGLLVLAVTDSIYVARDFTGHFRQGTVLDLGWMLSFALVALAATSPEGGRPIAIRRTAVEPPTMGQHLLPYLAMLLAAASVLVRTLRHGFDVDCLWVLVPTLLLVGVRQLVVVADHAALARDLSDQVRCRTGELQRREQWWREILANLTDVVLVIDPEGRIRYASPSLETALGHVPDLGTVQQAQSQVHPDDLAGVLAALNPVVSGRARQGFAEGRVVTATGAWKWFEFTAVGQLDEEVLEGAILTLHDVSERRVLTDRLAHQAYHDALTGLPNREMLMERIAEALLHPDGRRFALMLVDLDDFKVINDRHGHAAGDVVLEVIGGRITETVADADVVARLGGDEFAVLVSGTADHVNATALRICDEIKRPVVAGERTFHVRGSIGVVLPSEEESESAHSLLSHADIALYEAKAHDKGGVVLIDGPARAAAAKQVQLREQIAQPQLDQFFLVYQPLVDLGTGTIRGVESLLRWQHPDLGLVPPDEFIAMAELGGSIQELGWHVLRESCAQLARWQREFPGLRLTVGVNVSVRQLDEPGFAQRALAVVAEHGLAPDQVVIEITEQSIAIDFETAVAVVAELRDGGLSVAVDDYGTGYSSLRYLHRFAADAVKIDRSFIWNLEGSDHTQKIVASVVDMAGSLQLQTIAEGIETPEQLRLVRELGCDIGQGYLFSRPVPARSISAMLSAGGSYLDGHRDAVA